MTDKDVRPLGLIKIDISKNQTWEKAKDFLISTKEYVTITGKKRFVLDFLFVDMIKPICGFFALYELATWIGLTILVPLMLIVRFLMPGTEGTIYDFMKVFVIFMLILWIFLGKVFAYLNAKIIVPFALGNIGINDGIAEFITEKNLPKNRGSIKILVRLWERKVAYFQLEKDFDFDRKGEDATGKYIVLGNAINLKGRKYPIRLYVQNLDEFEEKLLQIGKLNAI